MHHLLIVEDDPQIAQTLRDILEVNGFRVSVAVDGLAGLEAARRDTPTLVLTDVSMPNMTGLEMIEHFRREPLLRSVPVIIVSALGERADIRRGMGIGAADYIPKPFTEVEVMQAISAQMARKAIHDEVDAFAHTVAHDLRSPLTTLYGHLQMASLQAEKADCPEAVASLAVAFRTAVRLNDIIDDLLLLSDIRREVVEFQPLDMGATVTEALERIATLLRERNATVQLPEAWPQAIGHAPWVSVLWANLISNAAKYGGPSPVIEVGAQEAPESGYLRCWVRDHGAGIRRPGSDNLFTPEAHIPDRRKDSHGLGLSIVRRAAERMGGRCGGETAEGGGSRFWFDLPQGSRAP